MEQSTPLTTCPSFSFPPAPKPFAFPPSPHPLSFTPYPSTLAPYALIHHPIPNSSHIQTIHAIGGMVYTRMRAPKHVGDIHRSGPPGLMVQYNVPLVD